MAVVVPAAGLCSKGRPDTVSPLEFAIRGVFHSIVSSSGCLKFLFFSFTRVSCTIGKSLWSASIV